MGKESLLLITVSTLSYSYKAVLYYLHEFCNA